jgi:hypothetical protein
VGATPCCALAGDFPEGNQCGEDTECQSGYVCANFFCRLVCDLNAPKCGAAAGCQPFGRYPGVGYCAP